MNGYWILLRGSTIVTAGVFASQAAFAAVAKPIANSGDTIRFIPTVASPTILNWSVALDCTPVLTPL